jgi:hypothetical protein
MHRIIDASGAEQGKRSRRTGWHVQRAIDDRVVHRGELGRVEDISKPAV